MDTAETGDAEVVVVEDEVHLAELYATWLGDHYRVAVAHDCEAAYELLDETVDVALLDRNLPDGDGAELLTHVRDEGYGCRVAMVTAVEPGFDVVEMGFDDYLTKPATKGELRDTVARLLDHGEYREGVADLFALARKKALLEANVPDAELAASEAYRDLCERIAALDDELADRTASFSERQFSAELSDIGSDRDAGAVGADD